MVQLFLDKTEIIPDASTTIKVTKENPYFTLSDSYTLEVSVPLDIYSNRLFFGSLQRTEKSKKYTEYEAVLSVDNKVILKGQARITQSTQSVVKLQLTTGVSALKMTANNQDLYIDEMDLGKCTPTAIWPYDIDPGEYTPGYAIPLIDETNEIHANICTGFSTFLITTIVSEQKYIAACPNLISVAKMIAAKIGYTLDTSNLPYACNNIYIITAIESHEIAKKLPHWTVSEFFDQLQNFFGCTIEDEENKTLKLVQLDTYKDRNVVSINPTEEFEVDYTEDDEAKGVINTNLEYSLNGSDTETVDEEILEHATQTLSFANIAAAKNSFNNADTTERMKCIYDVNGELYVGWEVTEGKYDLKRIAPFRRLTRYEDASYTSLKISPVHIMEDEECEYSSCLNSTIYRKYNFTANLPSCSNDFGLIDRASWGGSGESDDYTMQGLIEGDEEVVSNEDKEDLISVAFFEYDKSENITAVNPDDSSLKETHAIHLAFTDKRYKEQFSNNHSNWSFSLNKVTDFDFYLGQLHVLNWQCSRKCKLKVTFEADTVPDPKNIYIIRNKRYACEKIEADIKNGKLEPLMTGYFHEMTDN